MSEFCLLHRLGLFFMGLKFRILLILGFRHLQFFLFFFFFYEGGGVGEGVTFKTDFFFWAFQNSWYFFGYCKNWG